MARERDGLKDKGTSSPKTEGGSISRRDMAGHAVAAMAVGASVFGSKASAQAVRPQEGRSMERRIEIHVPRDLHLSPESQRKLKTDFQNEIVEIIRKNPVTMARDKAVEKEVVEMVED